MSRANGGTIYLHSVTEAPSRVQWPGWRGSSGIGKPWLARPARSRRLTCDRWPVSNRVSRKACVKGGSARIYSAASPRFSDPRILQQRHQIVGGRAKHGILEVDDPDAQDPVRGRRAR